MLADKARNEIHLVQGAGNHDKEREMLAAALPQ